MRFGLHALTGRREDRLLFDHQIRLARTFGYEDASYTLAVEQLMQRYYRTVMDVSLLNELLLQLFREAILTESEPPRPLNARFQVRNGSLEAVSEEVFARTPSALLELFVLLQQNPQVRGVRASTMRAVARNLWLIDEEFRQNPRHHRLFLEILRSPVGVTHELRRMNTYGVLGRYIPAFGRVVGRMQYDLFHAYTVDAHTLFVVSNLRRFAMARYDHELPEASRVMQTLPRCEVAYLAALFHDLAKGRGGDHSELGAVDAEAFCLEQGLSPYDARLVAWLVRNHLRAVTHLAEAGHRRSAGDQRVRAQGGRRDAPRLPLRAHLRRRARHQPEAVELLEGLALQGPLPAREACPATRAREPDRPRAPGARDPGCRTAACGRARCERARHRAAYGRASRRATSCSIPPRRLPGTRGSWPSATRIPTSPW